ncbi:glycoside hydrolase superfamily [Aspergillus ambiguus]|uniref:glycoside hydrolase family 18 protein n=1 Tax=Aspergillus ambiguus TaxID=176160 RepID=UPI003CCD48B8
MPSLQKLLAISAGLTSIGGAYAKLDLSTSNNVVVYWGQNSFDGQGELAQQRLGHYCDDDNIDVIVLAFVMTVNGQGGVPSYDFSTTSKQCKTFDGTGLKDCPEVGEDIKKCQKKGKSIILSIGGATYSEGGFESDSDAKAGAELIWKTFGPSSGGNSTSHSSFTNATFHQPRRVTNGTKHRGLANGDVHRPFGDASVDGFDFDFEAATKHMLPFAKRLRELMDAEKSGKYFLTAAPQCPYPDAADKDILNGDVSIDAVWVQFYNNFCGVNSFQKGQDKQKSFNFETWANWAKKVSQNKKAKIFLGVPANTKAASTGYVPASDLEPVIEYCKTFESFGGVMMWDVTQAYGNEGFLDSVRKALSQAHSELFGKVYGVTRSVWRA